MHNCIKFSVEQIMHQEPQIVHVEIRHSNMKNADFPNQVNRTGHEAILTWKIKKPTGHVFTEKT